MIVRDRPGLFQVMFAIRGSVLQRIYPQILLVMALSVVVLVAHWELPRFVPVFNGAPFALLGVALSIFLGFRNSACYDRWWEARKHWGLLVATCRDLSRQTLLLDERGPAAAAKRREILYLTIAFTYALVDHLRHGAPSPEILPLVPEKDHAGLAACGNKPAFLLMRVGKILAELRADDTLSGMEFSVIDGTVFQINGVLAACERLRSTPVPFGYTLLLLRTAYIFCFLVPFGFADVLGWTTPIAAAVFAYTFFGLDALGDELEEPFGDLPNDLPIRAIAVNIDISVRESMGERDLPKPLTPTHHVLL